MNYKLYKLIDNSWVEINPDDYIETPSQYELQELFTYHSGKLHWNIKVSKRIDIGHPTSNIKIKLHNNYYVTRLLVWIYHYGDIPFDKQVGYIKYNGGNHIENLRLESAKDNKLTARKLHCKNTSGYPGVTFVKANNKYRATIRIDGKNRSLGLFNTIESAIKARMKAEKLIYQVIGNN